MNKQVLRSKKLLINLAAILAPSVLGLSAWAIGSEWYTRHRFTELSWCLLANSEKSPVDPGGFSECRKKFSDVADRHTKELVGYLDCRLGKNEEVLNQIAASPSSEVPSTTSSADTCGKIYPFAAWDDAQRQRQVAKKAIESYERCYRHAKLMPRDTEPQQRQADIDLDACERLFRPAAEDALKTLKQQ
jgi:hypothetical protein